MRLPRRALSLKVRLRSQPQVRYSVTRARTRPSEPHPFRVEPVAWFDIDVSALVLGMKWYPLEMAPMRVHA